MLRPNPEQTLFGHIPVRLIISILLVFAIVISIVLILGIEREKNLVAEMTREGVNSPSSQPYFLKTQGDVVKITVVLFLLSVVGVSVIVTYQSYHTTRRTLESVKNLTRNILGSIPTGVITVDPEGRMTSINPAAERIFGFKGVSLGKRLSDFLPEGTAIRQFLTEMPLYGKTSQDQTVLYPGGSHNLVLWMTISELKNEEGRRKGLVLLVKDISEIHRLEQQVRRSEKLSAINTLSAAVAHEIRNPLSAMDLNLGLLEEEILSNEGGTQTVRDYLDVLNFEVKRLKGILDDFARFSLPSELVLEEIKLESILQHLTTLIRREAQEKGIEIETCVPAGLPAPLVDENKITQVFLNIMMNAIQAMPSGGKLTIQGGEELFQGERWIYAKFADTGIGIDPARINKIFEPFFSTRSGGMGLGLAIAFRIVEDHGGTIHVESGEGRGSVFTVHLPIRKKEGVRKI